MLEAVLADHQTATPLSALRAKLVWIPIGPNGASLAADDRYLLFRFDRTRDRMARGAPVITHAASEELVPASQPERVQAYEPVWIFSDAGGQDFVAISAHDGRKLAASVVADPLSKNLHIAVVIAGTFFFAWYAMFLFTQVLGLTFAVLRIPAFMFHAWTPAVTGLVLSVLFWWWLWRWTMPVLYSALSLDAEKRVTRTPEAVRWLFHRGVKLSLALLVIALLTQYTAPEGPEASRARFGTLLQIVAILGLVWAARRAAIFGDESNLPAAPDPDLKDSAPLVMQLAVVAFRFLTVAVILAELAAVTPFFEMWESYTGSLPETNRVEKGLVQLALMAAFVVSPIVLKEKIPLLVGLMISNIGQWIFEGPGPAIAAFAAVAVINFVINRNQPKKKLSFEALLKALRFSFASTLGKVVGAAVGALTLGSSGLIAGEALGEELGAAFAATHPNDSDSAPEKFGSRSPSD